MKGKMTKDLLIVSLFVYIFVSLFVHDSVVHNTLNKDIKALKGEISSLKAKISELQTEDGLLRLYNDLATSERDRILAVLLQMKELIESIGILGENNPHIRDVQCVKKSKIPVFLID